MLGRVLASLRTALEGDEVIGEIASAVLLQSRLKAAPSGKFLLIYICNFHVLSHLLLIYICKLHWNPSAFKKMVKGGKVRDQLYDLLGLRIVIAERVQEAALEVGSSGRERAPVQREKERESLSVNRF